MAQADIRQGGGAVLHTTGNPLTLYIVDTDATGYFDGKTWQVELADGTDLATSVVDDTMTVVLPAAVSAAQGNNRVYVYLKETTGGADIKRAKIQVNQSDTYTASPDATISLRPADEVTLSLSVLNIDLTVEGGGGGGATNLAYTASPTNGVVTSDTGTDATVPLSDGTNAGLLSPAQHSKLAGIEAGAQVNEVTQDELDDAIADLSGTYAPRPAVDGSVGHALKILSLSPLVTEWGVVGGATVDVVSNVAQNRILGRTTAGSGDSEELTAAQVKTLLAIAAADISDASANGRSLLTAADYSAMRTLLGLVIGTNVQAYDADLTTWAGLTPSANAQSLVTAANYAAMRTLLGLVVGTDVQAYSAKLAAEAAAPVSHGSMGSTETFDATAAVYHYGTLDANSTFTFTAGASGTLWELVLELLQDGTGSRTVTWPASVKWSGGVAPVLTTTASRRDFVTFWTRDGGTTWWGSFGPQNLV